MAFEYAFTDSRRYKENVIALTFVRLFGLLSMIASGLLCRDIARKLYSRSGAFLQKVTLSQSILIVLAIADFFGAFFVQFISTWMVPVHSQLLGAVGSQQSCVAQGFLSTFFYSLSALTNASLAVAYCLILRRGWDDKDKSRNRLPFVLIPSIASLVLAVAPLFGSNYNYNGGYSCYISGNPPGCELDPNPHETCSRGAQAREMLLYVGLIPALAALLIVTIAVLLLIHTVLVQERRMDKYQRTGRSRKLTMESFWQGMFYIGTFAFSWVPWLVFGFREYTDHQIDHLTYYIMLLITPLHGVLNAFVYFRPRVKSERGRNPNDSRCKSLMKVLQIKCCRSKSKERAGNPPIIRTIQQVQKDAEMGTKISNPKTTIDSELAQDAEIAVESQTKD